MARSGSIESLRPEPFQVALGIVESVLDGVFALDTPAIVQNILEFAENNERLVAEKKLNVSLTAKELAALRSIANWPREIDAADIVLLLAPSAETGNRFWAVEKWLDWLVDAGGATVVSSSYRAQQTALHWVVRVGSISLFRHFYGNGLSKIAVGTAFIVTEAAKYGREDVLRFLETQEPIDFAFSLNTPVLFAAEHGHVNVLKFLRGKKNVDFAARNNAPALRAAENGHTRVLEFLATVPARVQQ